MKNAKKGFTLVEMLIVVAIIAILVAITIPVLNGQLENAREAADAANLRAAYAEAAIKSLEKGGAAEAADAVVITQHDAGWKSNVEKIGNVAISGSAIQNVKSGDKVVVGVDNDGKATFKVN